MAQALGSVTRSAFLIFAAMLVACGAKDGDPGPDAGEPLAGLVSLAIEPADQTLIIVGDTPATSTYQAIGTFDDGRMIDVTAHVAFSVGNPALGVFTSEIFKSTTLQGGITTVTASGGGAAAEASLTLVLQRRVIDPDATDVPANVEDLFTGTVVAGRAPEALYPNDGVLVPPNLGRLEFHFRPGADNDLFEVAFVNAVTDVRIYTRCTTPVADGCVWLPHPTFWRWIAETNRGTAPLAWHIRGTDDNGTGVGSSGQMNLEFSIDDIDGGIYYWTTSQGTAIMRFDFGSETQTEAERFVGTEMTGGTCVGCHALSRDGTKMVTATDGSTGANVLLLDVATKTPKVPYDSTPQSAFSAWAPDGSRYVGVYGGSGALSYDLNVLDGDNGSLIETIAVGGTNASPANHPDWSPDGERIAYVRVANRTGSSLAQSVYRGQIEVVERSGTTWSAPQVIVPTVTGQNHYYPTFSPDGALLAFDQSTCPGGTDGSACDSYEDPSARLQIVAASPGSVAVDMTRANAPGITDGATTALTNSFPKWSPFVFRRTAQPGSRLEWITFSSTRRYGLRQPAPGSTLIWMSGVDPDQALLGTDPSSPAFVLPFQDKETSNHTAQWTQQIVVLQ